MCIGAMETVVVDGGLHVVWVVVVDDDPQAAAY